MCKTEISQKQAEELIRLAFEAQTRSYSPYSHFATGAALRAWDGRVFQGCNIENAAYSPTICAERAAFAGAVSQGAREFAQIAIVGGYSGEQGDYCPPCGVCRQVMMEFCDPEQFQIILARGPGDYRVYLLKDLLPEGFGPSNLT
jgi:cytidine deaminase